MRPANRTALALYLLIVSAPLAWAQQYIISTYAGGAPPPTPIAGLQASIGQPSGVVVDTAGMSTSQRLTAYSSWIRTG